MISKVVIVFDAVGTIIRPADSISLVYQQFGSKHGSDLDKAEIKRRFRELRDQIFGNSPRQISSEQIERDRWQQLVQKLFHELTDTTRLFEDLWKHYSLADSWTLFPDTPPCLTQLLDQGIPFVIGSNFDQRLKSVCRALPPLEHALAVYCSSQVGYCKPDIRFFNTIRERLIRDHPSINATTTLAMIGDDPVKDVQAARQAGWLAEPVIRRQLETISIESDQSISPLRESLKRLSVL